MKKSDNIIVTPSSSSKSNRKNYSITPILKKFTSNTAQSKIKLKPILKSPPPPTSLTETWSPSQKKSMSTPILSQPQKPTTEKRIASLQTIKQKFMLKEQPLPWEQYMTPTTVNCQKSTNYDDMIQELNISHALGASSNFKTMSFVDADKLFQKYQHLKTVIESMYDTLRVQTDTTRATVMTLKLDAPQNKQFCQLNEYAIKIDGLLKEFYFTSKYANHLESTYLQHLAGTLLRQKEDNQLLTNFLSRLERIIYDNNNTKNSFTDIEEQMNFILEKITQRFKNSGTMEELTKQRERSASLVLELEKNRTLFLSEQKEHLFQSEKQILLDRVTELENTIEIKDKKLNYAVMQLEEYKIKMYQQEETQKISQYIKDQCPEILHDSVQEVVQDVVQNYKKSQFQLKELTQSLEQNDSLHNNNNIVLLENQALLETNLKNESLLKSKQAQLVELELHYQHTIQTYTTRESAYILQSASTEAELERILKEYDRLTRNISDFNLERKKLESEIRQLQVENLNLSKELSIEQVQNIHGNDSNLRKEFRDLMAMVKEQHVKDLTKLADDKKLVEQELKEKMSEIEFKRWEKVDSAVQTSIF